MTKRLAEEGFAAITPDIYGGDTYSYDDMDGAIGKLKTMDDDTVMSQTEACLTWLDGRAEADSNRAGVTGFCMGGRFTFLANAQLAKHFKGAAAFYGGGIGPIEDGLGVRLFWKGFLNLSLLYYFGMARRISRYFLMN